MLTQAKQIFKLLSAMIGVAGFTTGTANNDTITAPLTTVLSTAGNGGTTVPMQVGSATQMGIGYGSAAANYIPIYLSGAQKTKAQDINGNDIYAKLSATNVLTYFSAPGGVETAYTWPAATAIDFEVPYIFSFDALPIGALVGVTERHVAPDPKGAGMRFQNDVLVPTAVNTLPALSLVPNGVSTFVFINGVRYLVGTGQGFTLVGQQITVVPAVLGFSVATTDDVEAVYSY